MNFPAKMPVRGCLAATLSLILAVPLTAMATDGYFSHGYGIKAKGMGGVGIALPQDAIAAANNPAGMALIGNRIDFGLDLFRPQREAERQTSGETFEGNDEEVFFIPEFGYNYALDNTKTAGVSVFGNGGMNSSYNTNPFTGARENTGVDLSQLFIAPTFAMKWNDRHSFGVSINLAFQRFQAEGLADAFGPLSTAPDKLSNNGHEDSFGYGISLGWIGELSPMVSLGAMYRSRTWMQEFDDYSGLFAEEGDFDIPETYGLGIAVRATPKLTIGFDVQQINYGDIDSIANRVSPAFENCFGGLMTTGLAGDDCLGGSNGPGFGWEDMTVLKLGVSYEYSPDLVFRAGWNHGEQPIPDSESTFNVLAPGVVEDHLTLGATWTLANDGELSVAYMHAFEKTVEGDESPLGPDFNYDLTMYQDSLGVAYGWRF